MKTGIYILGVFACVQTITFTCYLTYKYFRDNQDNRDNRGTLKKHDTLIDKAIDKVIDNTVDKAVDKTAVDNVDDNIVDDNIVDDNIVDDNIVDDNVDDNTTIIKNSKEESDNKLHTIQLLDMESLDENIIDSLNQHIGYSSEKRKELYNILDIKRKELIFLINELNKMQNNIGDIRLKLEDMHTNTL
jgi:hypothetical protein